MKLPPREKKKKNQISPESDPSFSYKTTNLRKIQQTGKHEIATTSRWKA